MFVNKSKYSKIIDKIIAGELENEYIEKSNDKLIKKLFDLKKSLSCNKQEVKKIMMMVLDIAVGISSFNVKLKHESNEIMGVTNKLQQISNDVHSVFEEINSSMLEVGSNTDHFVKSIEDVSHKANNLSSNAEQSNNMILDIREEIRNVTDLSKGMSKDVKELIEAGHEVNNALESINEIAEQVNLLALNASIEAARAGEHGKGFNVVAEEVRKLSIDTKEIVESLGGLIQKINTASNNSSKSVEKSVDGINNVDVDLDKLKDIFGENINSIKGISGEVEEMVGFSQELNATTEEISSAMENTVGTVEDMAHISTDLVGVSENIDKVATSIESLEDKVSEAAHISGKLGTTDTYRITNEEFINIIEPTINAHENWMNKLYEMVEEMKVLPLQTNDKRCSFGHFYHSVEPQNNKLSDIWKKIDHYHIGVHSTGDKVIECIENGDKEGALQYYEQAKENSDTVISMFKELINVTEGLSKEGKDAF